LAGELTACTHGQSVVIRFDAIFELGYSDMELHWLSCHAAAVLHHGFEFTYFKGELK
jgi:hypothetical protein